MTWGADKASACAPVRPGDGLGADRTPRPATPVRPCAGSLRCGERLRQAMSYPAEPASVLSRTITEAEFTPTASAAVCAVRAGQGGAGTGQRRRAAGAGGDSRGGQVRGCPAGGVVGDRDGGVQAGGEVRPGDRGDRAAVEPGHDRVRGRHRDRPSSPEAGEQARGGVRLHSKHRRGGRGFLGRGVLSAPKASLGRHATLTGASPVVRDGRLGQRADAHRHRHQAGWPGAGGGELGVEFGEQGGVAFHDPGGHLLVAGPGRVLDQGRAGVISGPLAGGGDGLVVAAGDLDHLGALAGDGGTGGGPGHGGDEDPRGGAGQPCHPGDRPAVVAVGGGDEDQARPAGREFAQPGETIRGSRGRPARQPGSPSAAGARPRRRRAP